MMKGTTQCENCGMMLKKFNEATVHDYDNNIKFCDIICMEEYKKNVKEGKTADISF